MLNLLPKNSMSSPQDSIMDKEEAKAEKEKDMMSVSSENELLTCHAKFEAFPFFKTPRFLKGAKITLRLVTIVTTFIAMLCMITSHQSTTMLGTPLDARYSYSPAFRFFVYANAVACFFIFLSLLATIVFYLRGACPTNKCSYLFFLNDMMMLTMEIGGCAAATAIGEVGLHGNSHAGWGSICGYYGKFCDRVTISLVFSYVSIVSLFILTVISSMNFKENPL
ncbi:CASP-like protein 1F2 [Arachis stenosperma]|nr:CASP-like protein 1F2 [Arachis stenosperma]